MSAHEFGIMNTAPLHGKRFDKYEPEKYNCISVDDIYIENILDQFDDIDTFSHSVDIPEKGLIYCGITLIPPSSLGRFRSVVSEKNGLRELSELLQKAERENKFVIHFGI